MKMTASPLPNRRLKDIAASVGDVFKIDESDIEVVPGFNRREDFGDLALLAGQIVEAGGVKQPLVVRLEEGRVLLVHGERRLRATRLALGEGHSLPPLPCIAEARGTTEAERALSHLLLNDGKPLTLSEEASVIADLKENHGLDERAIAVKTARSVTHVRDCLKLIASPETVQMAVKKGKIAASLVIDLIKETKGDEQALEAKVTAAIETAKSDGKDHASRKHVDSSQPSTLNPQPAPVGEVPFADVKSSGGGSGPGEPRLSRDTTGNLKKLNAMLEKLDREKCIPALYELTDLIVDVLEGNQSVTAVKNKLLL